MSRNFILTIYRALKMILAEMEREYKLGVYAAKEPMTHAENESVSYVLDN